MLSLIRRAFHPPADPAAAETIRTAREAAGWSQERLADELGVMPVEVAAWESGAIGIPAYDAQVIRWKLETAAHEARLPRSECYWMRANEERIRRMNAVGPRSAMRVERERDAHVRECAECLRVQALLRDAPAPPERPLRPGFRGRLDVMRRRIADAPAWLRVPLLVGKSLIEAFAVYLSAKLLLMARHPSRGLRLSAEQFALVVGGFAWFVFVSRHLQPRTLGRPYLFGLLCSAAVAIPGNLVLGLLGHSNLFDPGSWVVVLLLIAAGTWFFGMAEAQGLEEEARVLDPLPPEPETDREREVFIKQQDTSFRV